MLVSGWHCPRSFGSARPAYPRSDGVGMHHSPSGAIDSCGGVVLANVLPQIKYGGVVSACGLASGMGLVSTVAPFILRGVTLAGVETALLPLERRIEAYNRFGPMLTQEDLSQVTSNLNTEH